MVDKSKHPDLPKKLMETSIEGLLQRFVGRKSDAETIEEMSDEIELLRLLHSPPTKAKE